ncbi:MAG: hypothetical protein WCO16_00135 [bacterium]
MPAKFSDIIPPNKRSIRNVPLSISVEDKPTHVKKKTLEKDTRDLMKIINREEKKVKSKIIWGVAVFCVVVLSLIIVSKFATATASIVASKKPISVSMDLNLSHNSTSTNPIDYDVLTMSLNEDIPEEAIIVATGTKALGTKSTGTVTIYNSYSKNPQILVKNTRLESTDGKIFFLTDKVTVPGQTASPGSIDAKIVAEKDGTSYNVGIKNFTFPGLKSSAKYKTVYAKGKTEVAGGTSPRSKVTVSPDVLDSIHAKLLESAEKQITAQKPDDYIIIPGGTQELISVDGTSTAVLDISVLLIKKIDLAIQIQTNRNLDIDFSSENKNDILIDTSSIKLTLPEDLKLSSITKNSQIKATLTGTTTITSDLSDDVIKKEIAGLGYDNAQKLLKNKIGVEAVNLEIWPWWVKTVPASINKIDVKIENN